MKRILFVIAAIILLVIAGIAVIAFVAPTDFRVQREVVINKPKAEVFSYLRLLKNQNEWGPWVQKDPNIKLTYNGEDGKPGFISRWESEHNEVGHGEQEIKKIVDGERIDTEIRFIKPWESTSNGYLATKDAGEGKTKVKWGFTGSMPRPMNLMLVFTSFEAQVGKDFEEGLAKLKSVVEKRESPKPENEESGTGEKGADNGKSTSEKTEENKDADVKKDSGEQGTS